MSCSPMPHSKTLPPTPPAWALATLILGIGSLLTTPVTAGSACVMAKEQGNTLAVEWATGVPSVDAAIEQAKQALRKQGYAYIFPQANSALDNGWMVIVKTEYHTLRGRLRTSFGCGFSQNPTLAEQMALTDLRSYSWGWRPEMGYTIYQKTTY